MLSKYNLTNDILLKMQTTASVSGGAGQVVPAVQRDEDGARAARPPLGRRPPLRRRTLLPGVRRLPRRAGETQQKYFLII